MITPEQWILIDKYKDADAKRLRLAHHGSEAMATVIDQIDCRQRTAAKLHETLRVIPQFVFPSVLSAEQSTSDDLAEYHAELLDCNGKRVLDMTCGLGIDTLHFAQNACEVTSLEITPETYECTKLNMAQTGKNNVNVICGNSVDFLANLTPDSYDRIFIDPARRGDHGQRVFGLKGCAPDVTALLPKMLGVAPKIVIKASPMLDVKHTIKELMNVSRVIAVGTRTECKELVIICVREPAETPEEAVKISAVTINNGRLLSDFTFTFGEESTSAPFYGEPNKGDYLYVPYPASIKTGAFNILSARFNVTACGPNSHLFFSPAPATDFPGTPHEIIEVYPFSKKGIKALISEYKEMNVTVRNFPLSADALIKKLKVKPGGVLRLFATRTTDNNHIMILTKPIAQ